jgi:hypothetical protein
MWASDPDPAAGKPAMIFDRAANLLIERGERSDPTKPGLTV